METLIASFADKWAGGRAECLDVGSRDINGNYRDLIEARGWRYAGLDIVPGRNVDLVSLDPYDYPIRSESFDLVISGSTMEHVAAPWLWVPEVVRVVRPGGMAAIVTHWCFEEHHKPDYWRIMPDGLRFLLEETGELERIEVGIVSEWDIAGSAWKRAPLAAPGSLARAAKLQ